MTHTNTARPIALHPSALAKTSTATGSFRTVSPERAEMRLWSADALAAACEATGTSYAECAAALGMGRSAFAEMARHGGSPLNFADIPALHHGGCRKLAMRLLTDAIAFLESRTRRPGLSQVDHLRILTARLGALAAATTAEGYSHALRELQDRVRDAVLDVQEAA